MKALARRGWDVVAPIAYEPTKPTSALAKAGLATESLASAAEDAVAEDAVAQHELLGGLLAACGAARATLVVRGPASGRAAEALCSALPARVRGIIVQQEERHHQDHQRHQLQRQQLHKAGTAGRLARVHDDGLPKCDCAKCVLGKLDALGQRALL